MDLIIIALTMLFVLLWLVSRIERPDTRPSGNTFNHKWVDSSYRYGMMRKRFAETGLPPEPRHPYYDYLHNEAGRG